MISRGPLLRLVGAFAGVLLFAPGCTVLDPAPAYDATLQATVHAVTTKAELISFKAARPDHIVARKPVTGLAAGETLVGIDYRVARGQLYALSSTGRLYRLDASTGVLTSLTKGPPIALPRGRIGFDFNPAADRIRLVGTDGTNLRLHPDSGAVAAIDPTLDYDSTDPSSGQIPRVSGAAYTYNKRDEKLTTNYAIDLSRGTLVTQGSAEGSAPVISPNTGRLFTVGALGTGPIDDVAFDISDVDNTALAAITRGALTSLYVVDLKSGRARNVGTIGRGQPLWGMAIEP